VDQCFARGTHQLRSSAALRFSKRTGKTRNGKARPGCRRLRDYLEAKFYLENRSQLGNNCLHFGGLSALMIGRI
jgi:hypothetical protein